MKTIAIAVFALLPHLLCTATEYSFVRGIISKIRREQYKNLEWKLFREDVKPLDASAVHIVGYLRQNFWLPGSRDTFAIYEDKSGVIPNHEIVCVEIPEVYQPKLKIIKPGAKVEFFGVLFTKPDPNPINARHFLIRVDAIIPIK